jgi:SAM-dependent methyltransferase
MNAEQKRVSSKCPVCGSQDNEFIHRAISNVEAARHFLNPNRDKDRYEALCRHIAELWDRDYCSIRKCRDCGFGFSDPYIAGDGKFYSLAYDHKLGDYPAQKWEYKAAKDALKRRIESHGHGAARLIEIGAGDGAFLRQIVPELIAPERVFCTEYGEYAATQIRNLGIRVALGDIREMDIHNEKPFDIVCMFQVLEHMDRLTELFSALRTLTSPKADLLIAVPNSKRTEFCEHNGALLDMPPNHIGRWTRLSFEALAKREGWEVAEYIEQPTDSKESWQTFSHHRYARASQFDRSISARVRGLRKTAVTRTLEFAMVAAFVIRSVPLLPTLFSYGMGSAVLVNLRRQT